MARIEFDGGTGHQGEFIVEGERFTPSTCGPFAQIENPAAGIIEAVLRTHDDRYFRVTVVTAPVGAEDHRVPSWYEAHFLGVLEASLLRESWAVQVEQPPVPDVIP